MRHGHILDIHGPYRKYAQSASMSFEHEVEGMQEWFQGGDICKDYDYE